MASPLFVDQGPTNTGTTLDAATFNALVVAQTHLKVSGIPSPSPSLAVVQPATGGVINTGDKATYVSVEAQTLTLTADKDNYVDLSIDGQYAITPVATGATPSAPAADVIRLYKAVTNGSAVVSVTPLATSAPIGPRMVGSGPENAPATPLGAGQATAPAQDPDRAPTVVWEGETKYGTTRVTRTWKGKQQFEYAVELGDRDTLGVRQWLKVSLASPAQARRQGEPVEDPERLVTALRALMLGIAELREGDATDRERGLA